ncbi:MAG: enoyl-CoA hydratase/isomerase family protein [Betaproteobacteria bacterium]|nr:enoyl-CoA hydratase/isomerase family protein [Betaproteobacteria bacterium]
MAPLSFTRDGSVARLVFQRPDVLNALDTEMARGLRDACRSIAADPDVRVVVMSGAGRAFVAGGDIAVMREDPVANAGELIDLAHEALRLLAGLQAPVVASLHGVVAGGGLGIALSADLAIAAEGTRFNLAYANIGTSCDCGNSWALPRIVGTRKALEIALLSDTFDAQEALRLGLVSRAGQPQAADARIVRSDTMPTGRVPAARPATTSGKGWTPSGRRARSPAQKSGQPAGATAAGHPVMKSA